MKNCFLFLILCFQSLPVLSSSIEIDSVETRQIFENGRALLKAGYVDSSCIYFDQALERYLHLVESNPEDHIFKGYINAARAKVKFLEKKRLFEQAHEVLAQLLEFSILHLGEIHPYTAAVYNEIGVVYYLELDFNHAREYFEIALDVRVKALGEFSIDVANSYNNIGMV
ncbi:tetratricopeptide repeat protein, partial [candidate division KSB1 bacterium]|nr:tetratricopeptide repeat protein [candidate division KSB1 bacterium]